MSCQGNPSETWWSPKICLIVKAMVATSKIHAYSIRLPSISRHPSLRYKQSKSMLALTSLSTRWTRCEDRQTRIGRSVYRCRISSIVSLGSNISFLPWRRVEGGHLQGSDQVLSIWKRGSRPVLWLEDTSVHSAWSRYNKSRHVENSMNSYC